MLPVPPDRTPSGGRPRPVRVVRRSLAARLGSQPRVTPLCAGLPSRRLAMKVRGTSAHTDVAARTGSLNGERTHEVPRLRFGGDAHEPFANERAAANRVALFASAARERAATSGDVMARHLRIARFQAAHQLAQCGFLLRGEVYAFTDGHVQ